MSAAAPAIEPAREGFPRTFYFANAIELLERLAHFGMYIGLSLYLTKVVGFDDRGSGALLGNFRLVGSLAPIVCGAIADRISFKRSLMVAFSLYAVGYLGLFSTPSLTLAPLALFCCAIGGGFMKPVITGTVVRTAPEGRQVEGFAIFYRMINAGSVVGKSLAYLVRAHIALRFVMVNSVVASLAALGLAIFGYEEPKKGAGQKPSFGDTLRGYGTALKDARFTVFLVIFAGFYFMAEQFYMTFPKYVTRHIDEKAPLEIITLINPALIALGQGRVTRLFKSVRPVNAMILGVLIGALSMLMMGALPPLIEAVPQLAAACAWLGVKPGLVGACVSLGLFAVAEMTFSPRFYDYIASFAPEGRAGMYMGLAFVPSAIGAWFGGQASGRLIAAYLPEHGPRQPLVVWSSYAALGLGCALVMTVYMKLFPPRKAAPQPA